VTDLRKTALPRTIIVCCVILLPVSAHAQWWSSAGPRDFEECAERAKTAATGKDAVTDCEAKFAGRRKMGGGYTYYDFMQNRSFDIVGPNPTPEETKKDRRAVYRLSGRATPRHYRHCLSAKAAIAAPAGVS